MRNNYHVIIQELAKRIIDDAEDFRGGNARFDLILQELTPEQYMLFEEAMKDAEK
jgi:hypothetical protein